MRTTVRRLQRSGRRMPATADDVQLQPDAIGGRVAGHRPGEQAGDQASSPSGDSGAQCKAAFWSLDVRQWRALVVPTVAML